MKTKTLRGEIRNVFKVDASGNKVYLPESIDYVIKNNGKSFLEGNVWLVAKEGYNFDPDNIKYFSDYYDRNPDTGEPKEMVMSYTVELENNKLDIERMFIQVRESDKVIVDISMMSR